MRWVIVIAGALIAAVVGAIAGGLIKPPFGSMAGQNAAYESARPAGPALAVNDPASTEEPEGDMDAPPPPPPPFDARADYPHEETPAWIARARPRAAEAEAAPDDAQAPPEAPFAEPAAEAQEAEAPPKA